jgi:hypothetical protein
LINAEFQTKLANILSEGGNRLEKCLRRPDSVAIVHVKTCGSAASREFRVQFANGFVDRRTKCRTGQCVTLVDAFFRKEVSGGHPLG